MPTKKLKKRKPLSVWDTWKNKGFEKIDVEKELALLRREVQDNLDRKFTCCRALKEQKA
ncbi:MAG: hypothetical protein KAW12_28510 [Candidatus Aminicenantes bacterium]|nr:hypothetical protein [Candidatus Aminicenantes bacterium]